MADKIKTLLRLYKLYAKLDLLWFLRDTRYCLLYMATDFICLISSMTGVFLLAAKFGGFGGMSESEVFFLLGYSTLVDGIYMMFFMGNNTSMVSRIIGRGQLDHAMIQPVPIWMILLSQGFSPVSANSTLLCGILITGYAMNRLSLAAAPVFLLFLAVNALASCLIILAVTYLISCLAFYAPAAAEEIAQTGIDLFAIKNYPLGSLEGRVKLFFCAIVPVGLGAWYPSQALLRYGFGPGIKNAGPLMTVPLVAVLFIVITASLFKKGMRHYETYGSPRYSGFGYR